MNSIVLLTIYCLILVVISLAGGALPAVLALNHRRTQVLCSFVGGVMLGVCMLHLLPHAQEIIGAERACAFALFGFLLMFLVERFFCYHHHDSDHKHDITWTGAAVGLSVHSLLSGVALGSSVLAGVGGLGTFLAVALHRPFDSMTLLSLMERSDNWSKGLKRVVNLVFALTLPLGAFVFWGSALSGDAVGIALAISAGVFLCISLSDLLPELHFHQHDRVLLSFALLLGLAVAFGIELLEH